MKTAALKLDTKPSKLFYSYVNELEAGSISEGRINSLRRIMHNDARDNLWRKGSKSYHNGRTLKEGELNAILARIEEKHPRIIEPQQTKGLQWLLNQWKSPSGKERKNNPFGNRETAILENFSHFTLVDFMDCGRGGMPFYIPVYRVHAKNGTSFDYYASSWQSGGVMTICG